MSRINIEDKLWADPRFDALKIMLGNEYLAIGYMVKIFKLAQEHWLKKDHLIPIEIWSLYDFSAVEKVGLAERLNGGIYVKGSQDNFKWLENKREAGRKSAEMRGLKYGTSQPKSSNSHRTATEHLFDNPRTATEPPTPTPTPTPNLNTRAGVLANQTTAKTKVKKEAEPLSDDWLKIGQRWLDHALIMFPHGANNAGWNVYKFSSDSKKVGDYLKRDHEYISRLVDFIVKDDFWAKNAATPSGVMTKSKNGMRKIDNILTRFSVRNTTSSSTIRPIPENIYGE